MSAAIFGTNGGAGEIFSPGDELIIQMDLKANATVEDPVVSFALHDENNNFVFGTNSDWREVRIPVFQGKYRLQFLLKGLPFVEGQYFVTLGVHSRDSRKVSHLQE